jgi:hypothetical protein
MKKEQFWALIAAFKAEEEEDTESLVETLSTYSVDDIAQFEMYFQTAMNQSYTSELWGAAFTILGGCSNDSFDYFRGWLIAQGQEFFEAAVQQPEALATLIPDDYEEEDLIPEWEEMLSVGGEALTLKQTGDIEWDDEIQDQLDELMEKHGYTCSAPDIDLDWEEDDLPTRYPKLWARFGENPLG